jgi:5-enolpyruvylshikimate-3-phosphate synthase
VQGDDGAMTITPPPGGIDCSKRAPLVEFDTYDDHRMAMSLALIGLRRPHIVIREPACVAKTYPTFWRDLADFIACVR